MNKIYFLPALFFLVINHPSLAQSSESNCFEDVEFKKGFVALNTTYDSKLVNWYQSTFGMEVVKEFKSSNGESFGIILKKDGQYVEIIHSKSTLKWDITRRLIEGTESAGYRKIGIFTNTDLENLRECLKTAQLDAGRIYHDRELKIKLLHLIDPEGNQLEIISQEQ